MIWLQTSAVDGAIFGGVPARNRHPHNRAITERVRQLDAAFAIGGRAKQRGASAILQGASHDFAGAGAAFVDQHNHWDFFRNGAFACLIGFGFAVTKALEQNCLVLNEDIGYFHRFAQ